MTPSISIEVQHSLKEEICDYANGISRGFMTKDNIPSIIAKNVVKVAEELSRDYNKRLAKKYATELVNNYAHRIMMNINN